MKLISTNGMFGNEFGNNMTNDSQQFVNKAWNFAHVLRDDGLSYMAYTEQITFYAGSVKANVLFLNAKPAQENPWTKTL